MKRTLLTTLLAAAATAGALAAAPDASRPTKASTSTIAAPLETHVPGIAFVPLRQLPANPSRTALSRNCDYLMTIPTTGAGRQVRAAGWGVTAESGIGGRTVVSFVGSAAPATSGTCELDRGNVGVFERGRLVALAYVPSSSDRSIGRISPLSGSGARIWDGGLVPRPVGDLTAGADGKLVIDKVAGEDPVCNRAATVPNIYDQPIDRARLALMKAGWTPILAQSGSRDDRVAELAAAGIPEAEDCAGTGMGFCRFAYSSKAGPLSVITVGDGPMPIVSDYRVACRHR